MTSDRSQLAEARSGFKNPKEHIILDDVLSKEPLAPASDGQDQKLADAMRWVIFSLISAEEQGITKSNIDEKVQNPNSIPYSSIQTCSSGRRKSNHRNTK